MDIQYYTTRETQKHQFGYKFCSCAVMYKLVTEAKLNNIILGAVHSKVNRNPGFWFSDEFKLIFRHLVIDKNFQNLGRDKVIKNFVIRHNGQDSYPQFVTQCAKIVSEERNRKISKQTFWRVLYAGIDIVFRSEEKTVEILNCIQKNTFYVDKIISRLGSRKSTEFVTAVKQGLHQDVQVRFPNVNPPRRVVSSVNRTIATPVLNNPQKRDRESTEDDDRITKRKKYTNSDLQRLGNIFIMKKNLTCSICSRLYQNCQILQPCGHRFCSTCLYVYNEQLPKLMEFKCPTCRTTVCKVQADVKIDRICVGMQEKFPETQISEHVLQEIATKKKFTFISREEKVRGGMMQGIREMCGCECSDFPCVKTFMSRCFFCHRPSAFGVSPGCTFQCKKLFVHAEDFDVLPRVPENGRALTPHFNDTEHARLVRYLDENDIPVNQHLKNCIVKISDGRISQVCSSETVACDVCRECAVEIFQRSLYWSARSMPRVQKLERCKYGWKCKQQFARRRKNHKPTDEQMRIAKLHCDNFSHVYNELD